MDGQWPLAAFVHYDRLEMPGRLDFHFNFFAAFITVSFHSFHLFLSNCAGPMSLANSGICEIIVFVEL